MRTIVALLLATTLLAGPVAAQTRHDADQAWIRKTIKQERRAEWLAERRRWREHYDRTRYVYVPRRRHRHHHEHDGPRVYGYSARAAVGIQRDSLAGVQCFPVIESISVEANTEDGAWKDAQRNWENAVRWKYGERFMAVGNARDVVKQCSRSSGNQSVAGRITETVANAVGADGYKHRCQITAKPCMAPIERYPEVKSDK